MAGLYSSINTALTGLRHSQVGMDVTGNNIANVGSAGYTRRRVEAEAAGSPTQVALWSRYDGHGDGVRITDVTRMTDELLNSRSRTENGNAHRLDTIAVILARVEEGLGEPGDNGVSAALEKMSSAWADLANDPDSDAARSVVLGAARAVADAVNTQARNIDTELADQRAHLIADVTQVNVLAADLAATNDAIRTAKLDGTDASLLLDQRDQLALKLSQMVGGTSVVNPDGGIDIHLDGEALVSGDTAGSLAITAGVNPDGTADGAPVGLTLTTAAGTTATPNVTSLRGKIGGTIEAVDVHLADFRTKISRMASDYADAINTLHGGGVDQNGNPALPVFSYDPADPAGSLAVALTGRDQVASGSTAGVLGTDIALALADHRGGSDDYTRVITEYGSKVASTHRLAANQTVLTSQIDNARESLSGVNLDEEMVTMLSYQRSYEAAARLLTTIDSVLDTLINRTGVTR